MIVEETNIPGVKIIQPNVYRDHRGFFLEHFKRSSFEKYNIPSYFLQESHSFSVKNTIRGLHFQWDEPQGKLMRVISGEAFLVAVDIRKGSPTFGLHHSIIVNSTQRTQVWAPAGFARGFCALSDYVEIQYLQTAEYNPEGQSGIRWNDPDLKIIWPTDNPILSGKDGNAGFLSDWVSRPESDNFNWS